MALRCAQVRDEADRHGWSLRTELEQQTLAATFQAVHGVSGKRRLEGIGDLDLLEEEVEAERRIRSALNRLVTESFVDPDQAARGDTVDPVGGPGSFTTDGIYLGSSL